MKEKQKENTPELPLVSLPCFKSLAQPCPLEFTWCNLGVPCNIRILVSFLVALIAKFLLFFGPWLVRGAYSMSTLRVLALC